LALSGDEWIAVAGVSSGAIVGLGGLVFAYFNGKAERVHTERLARSGCLHEQRRLAYVEIARFLERQRLFLIRTYPFMGPKPAPPEPLGDDEWSAVSGLAAVSPSREVEAALQDAAQRGTEFESAAAIYQHEETSRRVLTQEGQKSARQVMDESRDSALAAITKAQHAMRDELASL
jgi:hypothetical protein